MATWYDRNIHESTNAIYVDSHTADGWDSDVDMDAFISAYRRRYFLPPKGSCGEKPVAFVVHHFERFLVCIMDISRNMLHILAEEQNLESWHKCNGFNYYQHICRLHGWKCEDASNVTVIRTPFKFTDLAHCSAIALAFVERIMEKGLVLKQDGHLHIFSSLGCQHLIRKKTFEYLLRILLNSYRTYGLLYKKTPSEWFSWGEREAYEPISVEFANRCMDMQRDEDVETMRQLRHAITICDDCQISLSAIQRSHTSHTRDTLFQGGRDRSGGHDSPLDKSPMDTTDESDLDYRAMEKIRRYVSRSRQSHPNQHLPKLGRFPRPTAPPRLPPPTHPFFPPHQPTFDDYQNGPTRDALLPYPGEYGLSEFSMVDRHRTFLDYGYRLLARFAHAFHLSPPVMLSDHVFPVGTPLDYVPKSCMEQDPSSLSRTFIEDDRRLVVEDVIEMGAEEMLTAAGSDIGSWDSQKVFVLGRNPSDNKLIRLNLERDHVPHTEADIKISAELDSLVFVGRLIKVLKSVKVYVTACVSRGPPISRDNHIRVELLLPLSTEERMECGSDRSSFLEKEFALSHIPHMRFADLGDGLNVYIFFPRATHHKWNTSFKDATVAYLDQWFFLQYVILPALRQQVASTDLARYGYDADGFNMKTASQTYTTGNKGTPKSLAVKPDVFHGMQRTMREIVDEDKDGLLMPYGSFFFVLEGKGIGLGLTVEDMSAAAPTQPLENLISHFSKIDFDFLLNRDNGESYFDVALSINPTSAHVGLWRLDALEASFGAGGFLTGKQFPLNTMGYYGSMQAGMEQPRRRQTHVLYRSSYLSFYNLSRNFENQPWAPSDSDVYHFSPRCKEVWNSRILEYRKGAQSQIGYGVRDEYRIGGQALHEFMTVSLEKVFFFLANNYSESHDHESR